MQGFSIDGDSSTRDEVCCALAADLIRQHGMLRFRALGSSMVPSIWPGEVLEARTAGIADVACGDVALFLRGSRLWAHRVVGRTDVTLITRGDGLETTDAPVTVEELLGRVVGVHRGGKIVAPELNWGGRVSAGLIRRSAFFLKLAIRCHSVISLMGGGKQAEARQSVSPSEIPAS